MSLDLFCFLPNQRFVYGFTDPREADIIFTQSNQASIRVFLLDESGYSGRFPFSISPLSGGDARTCIISLRDVVSGAVRTLCSSAALTPVLNGFSGILGLNTGEIADFVSERAERSAALCVDLIDGGGVYTSPFRAPVTVRGLDAEVGQSVASSTPGRRYMPDVTGYTGGGSTNADGISSVFSSIGTLFEFVVDGNLSTWRLEASTDDTDVDAGIIKLIDSGKNLIRVAGI